MNLGLEAQYVLQTHLQIYVKICLSRPLKMATVEHFGYISNKFNVNYV
jgi:hypothetical protein